MLGRWIHWAKSMLGSHLLVWIQEEIAMESGASWGWNGQTSDVLICYFLGHICDSWSIKGAKIFLQLNYIYMIFMYYWQISEVFLFGLLNYFINVFVLYSLYSLLFFLDLRCGPTKQYAFLNYWILCFVVNIGWLDEKSSKYMVFFMSILLSEVKKEQKQQKLMGECSNEHQQKIYIIFVNVSFYH